MESDISDEEAVRLLESSSSDQKAGSDGWKEEAHDGDVQVMRIDDTPQDPFSAPVMNFDVSTGALLTLGLLN